MTCCFCFRKSGKALAWQALAFYNRLALGPLKKGNEQLITGLEWMSCRSEGRRGGRPSSISLWEIRVVTGHSILGRFYGGVESAEF